MRHLLLDHPHHAEWHLTVPAAVYAYNVRYQSTIEDRPFALMFVREPRFTFDELYIVVPPSVNHDLRMLEDFHAGVASKSELPIEMCHDLAVQKVLE